MCDETLFQPAPHLNLGSLLADIPLLRLSVFHNLSHSLSLCISLCSLSCIFWFFPSPSLMHDFPTFSTFIPDSPSLPYKALKVFSSSSLLTIFARVCRPGTSQIILWLVRQLMCVHSAQFKGICVHTNTNIQLSFE